MKEVTLLEKFDNWCVGNKQGFSKDELIVFGILGDLTDRSGLQNVWGEIDDETQNEIIETWVEIVSKQIEK